MSGSREHYAVIAAEHKLKFMTLLIITATVNLGYKDTAGTIIIVSL
jgi:hypothetical protein